MASTKRSIISPVLLSGALILLMVALRAFYLSFTIDESITYTILQGNETQLTTANHHILNTFLMRISSAIFGEGEFALRLPNVLLCAVYILFVFRILKNEKHEAAVLLGAFVLLWNPFLVDFFSLARGYGLSIGFMMGSLYFFLRTGMVKHTFKSYINDMTLCIVMAILAMFSNLSTINFFMTILFLCIAQYYWLTKNSEGINKKNHVQFSIIILLAIVPLILAIRRLLFLKELKQLYFGVDSFSDTLATLYINVLERFNNFYILTTVVCIILVLSVIIVVVKKRFDSPLFKLLLILGMLVIATIAQHILFDAKYPAERTAMYFVPVFGLIVYYLSSEFYLHFSSKVARISGTVIILAIMTIITLNFFKWADTGAQYTKVWKFDAHTSDVAATIESLTDKEKGEKVTLSNHWLFESTLNYYINSQSLHIETALHDPDSTTTFVYNFTDQFEFDTTQYEVIETYDDIGTSLYRKVLE
ncbi:MAG: glycosyltransferase family 39 protein [Crocinitomicaceae bacterium]|nr:glycosyltransferase family 39 protein [Crocinitomicaceae bacterium]